ncbi:MAG: MFS transporter [Phycisphaerales bacterium]|nr:MFS transporter [Phycisphaerales bacterium]
MSAPESSTNRAEVLDGTTSTTSQPATVTSDAPGVIPAEPELSRWGVLRHKHYRNVLSAQFVSNTGAWMEMFAIQMFIAEISGRLDDQGILGACQQVPIFLLGILGGVIADRVNQRTLLVITQFFAGLVAVAVAVVAMMQFQNPRTPIHLLWALGALHGCVMAFNFPAWQVLTPRLIPRAELTAAITLNGIQFNMARVLGPVGAGYLLAVLGTKGTPIVLWFNAVTFLLMAGIVMTTPDAPVKDPPRAELRKQIGEAFSFLISNRGPRAVLFAQVMLSLLAAPLVRLLANFVIDVYELAKEPAKAVGGNLLAIQGLGAVAGGLALKLIPKWYPKHHFIPLAVFGLGLTITLFGLTDRTLLGYFAMGVCGWFWIWAFNQSWAALQVLVPDKIRGRAMSIATVLAFGATAVGVYIAGETGATLRDKNLLSAQEATRLSVLMLSVPLTLAGIVMMIWRVPEVDNMPRKRGNSRKSRSLVEAITASDHRPNRKDSDSTEPGPQPI